MSNDAMIALVQDAVAGARQEQDAMLLVACARARALQNVQDAVPADVACAKARARQNVQDGNYFQLQRQELFTASGSSWRGGVAAVAPGLSFEDQEDWIRRHVEDFKKMKKTKVIPFVLFFLFLLP